MTLRLAMTISQRHNLQDAHGTLPQIKKPLLIRGRQYRVRVSSNYYVGILCSGLAYIAWYDALKTLPTAQTGVFLYIEPLVAVVVAFFILSEPVTLPSLIGGAVIILGVWLVNRPTQLTQTAQETASAWLNI